MANLNTQTAAGIAPASRIPLFQVKGALRHATAHADAKAALRFALSLIPEENWTLRNAVRNVALTSGFESDANHCFDRCAVGVNHG